MNKKNVYLIYIIICIINIFSFCSYENYTQTIDCGDNKCECIDGTISYYENGNIEGCRLISPMSINNISCNKQIFFYEDGNLWACWNSKTIKTQYMDYPEDSYIVFNEDGSIYSIWYDGKLKIGNNICWGNQALISLFPDGKLRECTLAENKTIGNVTCTDITRYYNNENLEKCYLAEPTQINGVTCGKFYTINLFESGKLKSCTPQDVTNINGISCNNTYEVQFYENGSLELCYLNDDYINNNKKCQKYNYIYLDSSGNVLNCEYDL